MATTTRSEKLDLRLTPDDKRRIVAAAEVSERSVSEYVLSAALAQADETMADRSRFGLSAEKWTEFLEALDAPPRELKRVKRLFREPGLFDPVDEDK